MLILISISEWLTKFYHGIPAIIAFAFWSATFLSMVVGLILGVIPALKNKQYKLFTIWCSLEIMCGMILIISDDNIKNMFWLIIPLFIWLITTLKYNNQINGNNL